MADKAAFQVIVLGPSGGPREDMVTGLLVRSTSTQWSQESVVAVDAGTLLAGIIRTLDRYIVVSKEGNSLMKEGPFVGFNLPFKSAQANAAFFFQQVIGAILLTHPHLDHLAGLALNTPILEGGCGPRALAALPSILDAIKTHMFNDVIWPNLSDEDGGAGFITYQRLVEGGNPRFGTGETRGYVRACNGLLTKCLAVSHGRCKQYQHPDRGRPQRVGSTVLAADPLTGPSDRSDSGSHSPARSPRLYATNVNEPVWTTIESSAFFIRDYATGSEIIVFGDVEPDSLSIYPRNWHVWEVAAPKIAAGNLRAIFIECSFNDSVDDASLYGHLCPRHLIAELKSLSRKVVACQHSVPGDNAGSRKRAQSNPSGEMSPKTKRFAFSGIDKKTGAYIDKNDIRPRVNSDCFGENTDIIRDESPGFHDPIDVPDGDCGPDASGPKNLEGAESEHLPLAGLSVYIIHIKDNLSDGPKPGVQILQELRTQGEIAGLGCEFHVPTGGEGIWI